MTQLNFTSFLAYNFNPSLSKIDKESSLRFRLQNRKPVLLVLVGEDGVDIAVTSPPTDERHVLMLKRFMDQQQLRHVVNRIIIGPTVKYDDEGLTLFID